MKICIARVPCDSVD